MELIISAPSHVVVVDERPVHSQSAILRMRATNISIIVSIVYYEIVRDFVAFILALSLLTRYIWKIKKCTIPIPGTHTHTHSFKVFATSAQSN